MPIEQYPTLPWKVVCDTCQWGLGGDDEMSYSLYDTRDEALEAIRDFMWRNEDGVLTCATCLEEEQIEEQENTPRRLRLVDDDGA